MKKIVLIISAVLFISASVFGQNVDDALRYSQVFYGGTARFVSMGGAFTALGGDISSLSQNPAGLGVFRSSEITLSPQLMYINTTSSFHGIATDNVNNFILNQAGIVSNILKNNNTTGLITLNFGYSFNKSNDYYQSIRIQGVNPSSSLADYWAGISDGTYYRDLSGAEGIAYDAWVMDTITGTGGSSFGTVYSNYGDNPPSVYGQNVRRQIYSDGYTGEHAISIGGNYSNKLLFGVTFGINQLRYVSNYEHLESANTALPSLFKNFTYSDYYEDSGTGFTFKIGAIYKPVEAVRIGVAFHTPTWYHINEYFTQNITSNFTDGGHYDYSNDPLRFEYALATPYRLLGGVAVQVSKIAFLSADYEFVDYSQARFSQTGDGYNYGEKNANIRNSLKSASNIRLGGELRITKLYFRGGYGYYGKAFNANEDNAGLDYTSFSGGIGFREQNISVDFGYTNLRYSQKYVLYPLADNYDPAIANLSTAKNMFTLTFGYKFGY